MTLPFTYAGTLDALAAPHLRAPLVTPRAFARVREVADTLPAALVSWVHLECRLGEGVEDVDMIVRVDAAGRALLAAGEMRATTGEGWRRAVAMARRWDEYGDPGALRGSASLWLEFDVPADPPCAVPATIAEPGLFVELHVERAVALAAGNAVDQLAAPLLPSTPRGQDAARSVARVVRRCMDALPPGGDAKLYSLGVLVPRGDDLVRVCIIDPPADVAGYLTAVGWPGDVAEIEALLAPATQAMSAARQRVGVLHLDVANGALAPRAGFELVFDRASQVRGVLADAALFDHLTARGLCVPEKRDALRHWPGVARCTLAHELWPSVVLRTVNHVKLTWREGHVEAKAYLRLGAQPWHQRVGGASRRSGSPGNGDRSPFAGSHALGASP
jgi:hypothetical protein